MKYYEEIKIDAEQGDKLSYEELFALKTQFEEQGFICKFNQKKNNLQEGEICINGSQIFFKVKGDFEKIEPLKNLDEIKIVGINLND